jgi:hypothetical protein
VKVPKFTPGPSIVQPSLMSARALLKQISARVQFRSASFLPLESAGIIAVRQLECLVCKDQAKLTGVKSAKVSPSVESVLGNIVAGKNLVRLRKSAKLFSQGEKAEAIYFIQNGRVQIGSRQDSDTVYAGSS